MTARTLNDVYHAKAPRTMRTRVCRRQVQPGGGRAALSGGAAGGAKEELQKDFEDFIPRRRSLGVWRQWFTVGHPVPWVLPEENGRVERCGALPDILWAVVDQADSAFGPAHFRLGPFLAREPPVVSKVNGGKQLRKFTVDPRFGHHLDLGLP